MTASPCIITSASWQLPEGKTNPLTEGDEVSLKVQAGGNCAGKQIQFEIREDDGILPSDPVRINPANITLTQNNDTASALAPWTAEYQPDGLNGITDPPEYYFKVKITDSISWFTSGRSDADELKVNKPGASTTPAPTPALIPIPTPGSPTPTPTSQPPAPLPSASLSLKPAACSGYGDLNSDSQISQTDVDLLSSHLQTPSLTDEQKTRADVNADNNVNGSDLSLIQGYLTGSVAAFNVCSPIVISNVSYQTSAAVNDKIPTTLTWTTSSPAKSKIIYGASRTAMTSSTDQTARFSSNQSVSLELERRKLYYYKAVSTNGSGSVESSVGIIRTP